MSSSQSDRHLSAKANGDDTPSRGHERQPRSSSSAMPASVSSPASHLISSIVSGMQTAVSTVHNTISEDKRGLPDRVDDNSDGDYDYSGGETSSNLASVNFHNPNRGNKSAISTLGEGELSLASFASPRLGANEDSSSRASDEGLGGALATASPQLSRAGTVSDNRRESLYETNGSASLFGAENRGQSQKSQTQQQQQQHRLSMLDASAADDDDGASGPPAQKIELSGFAYASRKRNREFHKLFKSVPANDYLLEDYSCALNRDILVHGRMYVSERHVCFYSNILGWVRNLVIAFDEIVQLEKRNTAGLIPNGLVIQTLHARYSFASFVSRESTLELLTKIWKQNQSQRATSDKALAGGLESDASSVSTHSEDDGDDDDEDGGDDAGSLGSSSGQEFSDELGSEDELDDSARASKPNGTGAGSPSDSGGGTGTYPVPNLGPDTHAPTSLPAAKPNEKELATATVKAPLGVIANLVYGKDTSWYRRFVVDNQKNRDLGDLPSLADDAQHQRKYEYVKPLSGPVGPKQTKCLCTDSAETWDMENNVIVVTSTVTPDVPSGNSFVTKTRVAMAWAANNSTKIVITYWLEWSGKSWIKGAIEKGAADGQASYAKAFIAEIENSVRGSGISTRARRGSVKRTKKRKSAAKEGRKQKNEPEEGPQQGIVDRVMGIAQMQPIPMVPLPLWSLFVIVFSFFALRGLWGWHSSAPDHDKLRLMQIEEEYQMWKWIDDRAGFAGKLGRAHGSRRHASSRPNDAYRGYDEQDVREALRIAQHRLDLIRAHIIVDEANDNGDANVIV